MRCNMDLEKLAGALGMQEDLDTYRLGCYNGLPKSKREKLSREKLEEAIYQRISELVEKIEKPTEA